jgi:hypothetical protein
MGCEVCCAVLCCEGRWDFGSGLRSCTDNDEDQDEDVFSCEMVSR